MNNMFETQIGKKTNAGKCGLTTLILIIGECWGGALPFYKRCLAFIERTKHTGKSLIGSKSLAGLLSVKAGTLRSTAS